MPSAPVPCAPAKRPSCPASSTTKSPFNMFWETLWNCSLECLSACLPRRSESRAWRGSRRNPSFVSAGRGLPGIPVPGLGPHSSRLVSSSTSLSCLRNSCTNACSRWSFPPSDRAGILSRIWLIWLVIFKEAVSAGTDPGLVQSPLVSSSVHRGAKPITFTAVLNS